MPNTHETLTSLFDDIADAIRAKDGTSADIVADTFPTRISSIPGAPSPVATPSVSSILSATNAATIQFSFPTGIVSSTPQNYWVVLKFTKYKISSINKSGKLIFGVRAERTISTSQMTLSQFSKAAINFDEDASVSSSVSGYDSAPSASSGVVSVKLYKSGSTIAPSTTKTDYTVEIYGEADLL